MNYSYSYEGTLSPAGSIICLVICFAILVVQIVAMWKMFEKAGVEGWKSIIPFYNSYCLCDITMGNGLLFLLSFIPCVNFVFSIILAINLAKAYGKGNWFWNFNDFLYTNHVYGTCIFWCRICWAQKIKEVIWPLFLYKLNLCFYQLCLKNHKKFNKAFLACNATHGKIV